jgi:uncharacterized protein YlxW (UPF0749 family)
MKLASSLVLLACFFAMFTSDVVAQDASSAAQTAENLRARLREVQGKEAELQTRAKQIEEDLKPENIERSLAGVGSTRPEELRELRRRQLNIEKASLRSQLEQLASQRSHLEAAITSAEAAAYHQSAQGTSNQIGLMQYVTNPRWLAGLFVGLLAIAAIAALVVVVRRLN